jgi:hypothetical protein
MQIIGGRIPFKEGIAIVVIVVIENFLVIQNYVTD